MSRLRTQHLPVRCGTVTLRDTPEALCASLTVTVQTANVRGALTKPLEPHLTSPRERTDHHPHFPTVSNKRSEIQAQPAHLTSTRKADGPPGLVVLTRPPRQQRGCWAAGVFCSVLREVQG